MSEPYGYDLLARGYFTIAPNDAGVIAAPGSGSTITLWDSGANVAKADRGCRFKRIIVGIVSSAASAALGLTIDESLDDGLNWDNLTGFSISANTYTKNYIAVGAPRIRVRYANSANVLTAWRFAIMGDATDRTSP
jgi:hypothetical protein